MTTEPGLPDVSLRLLEIFAAMMRCATTVEAAEQLRISQPAVSAGLRQLESQLGLSLFDRTGRRLLPTAEAKSLYEEIRPVFGIMRGFSQRARDMKLGMAGRLKVIATPPLGYSIAPVALRRFLDSRPDVSVAFDVRRLENVKDAVQSGQADIGLAIDHDRQTAVNSDVLQRSHMVALVPRNSALATKPHLTALDLQDQPMIGLEMASNLGLLVRKAYEQVGAAYTPRIEVRYCATATALAAQHLGVTVVDPYSASTHASDALVCKPFLPACEVNAVMYTRRGVPYSGLLHSFMADLRTAFSDCDLLIAEPRGN
ncbi:LysR family transcriptional regulator [Allosediminivita pacifica]|uniref:DNA-binding transcriptional LysR family regulator n=1 Tax=Allosediminivita pacifica TaxID=1267769 RepID=A0A2T6AJC9_9RHOB|nr:LysR family transcriptional regulator [Allosediminivita pacifica]PTX43920.1 DNA-binding transcriptional LysR family regulator [Allosediminivita pacifica]GGB21674.1 LysR family transcriptional regulator [Allosediminivita pacifica]